MLALGFHFYTVMNATLLLIPAFLLLQPARLFKFPIASPKTWNSFSKLTGRWVRRVNLQKRQELSKCSKGEHGRREVGYVGKQQLPLPGRGGCGQVVNEPRGEMRPSGQAGAKSRTHSSCHVKRFEFYSSYNSQLETQKHLGLLSIRDMVRFELKFPWPLQLGSQMTW